MKKLSLIFVLLVVLAGTFSCKGLIDANREHKVYYKVTGTKALSITIQNESGGTEQFTNVVLPWEKILLGFTDDHFVYVSAQNANSGTISVYIYVDGKLFKSSSSNGEYAIASASGSF